jgi:hypothetical protein
MSEEDTLRPYPTREYTAMIEGWKLQGSLSGGSGLVGFPVDVSLILTAPAPQSDIPQGQLHAVLRSANATVREGRLLPVLKRTEADGIQFHCIVRDLFSSDLRHAGTRGLSKGQYFIDLTLTLENGPTITLSGIVFHVVDPPVGH